MEENDIYFRPEGFNEDGSAYFTVADPNVTLDTPVKPNSLTTLMTAVAGASYDKPASMQLQEQTLKEARDLLEQRGEFQVRLDVAAQQAQDQMGALQATRQRILKAAPDMIDPNVQAQIDESYNRIASQRLEDEAKTALEYATVAKVQDLLATDPVEARVLWDLYDKGDAVRVHNDAVVKNLIMQQRIQELEQEYENESWPSFMWNILTWVVPTNYNFSRAGVLKDAGFKDAPGGFMNWLLAGTGLASQGEYLWNLNTEDFARAMAKDGPVMQALKANTAFIGNDGMENMHILKQMDMINTSDKAWANGFGIVDPLFLVPWSKVGGASGALLRMGARKSSTAVLADTYKTILERGTEAAAEKYGVKAADVTGEVEKGITSLNPSNHAVSQSVDIDTHLKAAEAVLNDMPELLQVSRFNSMEELTAAIEARMEDVAKQVGQPIKEVKASYKNVRTGELTPVGKELPEQGNYVVEMEFVVGKQKGGGFASEKYANTRAKELGLGDAEVFQDVSGQWFIRGKKDVRELGFYTNPLETPEQSMLGFFRSSARTTDRTMQQKAVAAEVNSEKATKALRELVKKGLAGLHRGEKDSLDQVLRFGQNKEKWFSGEEFDILYSRVHGSAPTAKVKEAYSTYRLANDIDWFIRNEELYKSRVIAGYERAQFNIGDTPYDIHARISYDPQVKPLERIYDASSGWHYTGKDMTTEKLKKMIDEGYLLLNPATDQIIKFADGRVVNKILIKKSDVALSPLQKRMLGYTEGGHRAYKGTHFAKQTAKGAQPDTGQEYLLNPNVFITGNKNQVAAWAKTMNEAIDLYKAGERDATKFDDLFANTGRTKAYPDGEEFMRNIEDGKMSLERIEVTRDREMPEAYYKYRDNVSDFFDPEEVATTGYYRTTGRMYYSKKGEALKDWTGEFADTLDPWETLNTALYNVTRQESLSNYKVSVLERFQKNFSSFLELKNLENKGPYDVLKAPVRKGVPAEYAEKIEAERQHIMSVLRHPTELELKIDRATERVANWVLGGATDGVRERAHDFIYWVRKKDPVMAARGLAFDAKLGLFNPRQLFVQTQTMFASTALSPKYGLKGMFGAVPLTHYAISGSENALDLYAKRGVWKMAGFSSEQEFKEFARFTRKTGMLDVGNTHLLVNEWGPNRVWGATSKLGAVREYGRIMFYWAEQLNRSTAARIAWGELTEKGIKPGTAQFREKFIGLADDYSMNMTNTSAARMQKGLWSIPTQFWSYNARMMDAMFGKRFTVEQRRRLIATQLGLYGAAGVPVASVVMDYLKESKVIPEDQQEIGSLTSFIDRGAMDNAIAAVTDADVVVGKQLGAGSFVDGVIRDLLGRGEYGQKTPVEMIGGAALNINWTIAQDVAHVGSTLGSVLLQSDAEGGDGGLPLVKDSVINLAKNVSTFSNASKAHMVYNAGLYFSKKGNLMVDGVPAEDAFWVALGFSPAEMEDMRTKGNWKENRQQIIDDYSKQLINFRTEAAFKPDTRLENARKTEFLMNLAPEELRPDIIKKANRFMPDSYYSVLVQQYREEEVEDNLAERYNKN